MFGPCFFSADTEFPAGETLGELDSPGSVSSTAFPVPGHPLLSETGSQAWMLAEAVPIHYSQWRIDGLYPLGCGGGISCYSLVLPVMS